MSVTAGIAAVKVSLEPAKLLSDKLNRPDIDVSDVRTKVHEMLIHMVNAQVALGDANAEISDLRQKLQDREKEAAIGASLEFGEDLYWRRTPDHGLDGPYCPTCWDDDRKLIHLKFVVEGTSQCVKVVRRDTIACYTRLSTLCQLAFSARRGPLGNAS
jgi:hypothetical protein